MTESIQPSKGGPEQRYLEQFIGEISAPGTTIKDCLQSKIKADGPGIPLPFDLVLSSLPHLQPPVAHALLSSALNLPIWRDYESALFEFERLHILGAQDSGDWRNLLIPLVTRIWTQGSAGSGLRGWAACWLAERCDTQDKVTLSALTELAPGATRPGHYLRRFRLWSNRKDAVNKVLPSAIEHLADAWGVLGKDRLSDRVAVCVLLRSALHNSLPGVTARLQQEVADLLPELSDPTLVQEFLPFLNKLTAAHSCEDSAAPSGNMSTDQMVTLLQAGRASDAYEAASTLEISADINVILWLTVLKAEAARRSRSSSSALKVLDSGAFLLPKVDDGPAWEYHQLKAGLHWTRMEYHAALIHTDLARKLAGRLADSDLLYTTQLSRRRIASDLGLHYLECESNLVLDVLDQLRVVRGLPLFERKGFSFGGVLDSGMQGYGDVLHNLRVVRQEMKTRREGAFREGFNLSQGCILLLLRKRSAELLATTSRAQEPLLSAQLNFDFAQIAWEARNEWRGNEQLYRATITPWIKAAWNDAKQVEAYQLLKTIKTVVERLVPEHGDDVLRWSEIPKDLIDTLASRREDLSYIKRLLSSTGNVLARQRIYETAHRQFSEVLDAIQEPDSLSSDEKWSMLELLQDLKQPSLEDGGSLLPRTSTVTSKRQGELLLEDEDIIADDFMFPQQPRWRACVAEALAKDNAICIDLYVTNMRIYCFLLKNEDNQLSCRLLALKAPGENDLRETVKAWRLELQKIARGLRGLDNSCQAQVSLEQTLQDRSAIFPGSLRDVLSGQHIDIVYVAPMLGLHSIPLHAIQNDKDWSLSDVGTVFQIAKTRQLADKPKPLSGIVQILAGPEPDFLEAAQRLAKRIKASSTIIMPSSREQLCNLLQGGSITVICAHGWFDPTRPIRSRIALDHGLRLTLKDIQDLEVGGAEIVLLSCWAGWSARSNRPLGDLISAPGSWMVGGAGAVLAPLWEIPVVAGTHFIGDYLEARVSGESRANAVHHARDRSSFYELGALCRISYVLWGVNSV